MREKIQEMLGRGVLAQTGEFLQGTRDQEVTLTTDITKRAPIVGVKPSGIISITYKELPKKLTTAYTSVVSVNPTTGEIKTGVSHVYRGGKKIYQFDKSKEVFVEYEIIYQDGFPGTKQHNPKTGEDFIPLSPEDRALFEKSSKAIAEKQEEIKDSEVAMEQQGYYNQVGIPQEAMQRDMDSASYENYDKYRTGTFTEEDNGVEGDGTAITARVVPGDLVTENNRLVQERLVDFFHATGASVVLEGDTHFTGSYNLAVSGFIKNLDGTYIALETTHAIMKGRYVTTILCGRIPEDVTELVQEIKEEIYNREKRIIEKFTSVAKPHEFFNVLYLSGDATKEEDQYYQDESPTTDFGRPGTAGADQRQSSTKYIKDLNYTETDSFLTPGTPSLKTFEMSDLDVPE
jgi:hypothetical protein